LECVPLGSREYFLQSGGNLSGFLAALYRDVLGVPVDVFGLTVLAPELARGTSRAHVARQLFDTDAYRTLVALGAFRQFLRTVPDPETLARTVRDLRRGLTDEQLIANLLGSAAYLALL
jgi:hypothetical protein